MADFKKADVLVRVIEGVHSHSHDPDDRGKETYCGISRLFWPGEDIWKFIDKTRISSDFPNNIDHEQLAPIVSSFFQRNFWNKINAGLYDSQLIANQVYDIAVNGGTKTAGRYLQRTLNLLNQQQRDYADLLVDGRIGSKTITAMETYLAKRTLGEYILGFYLLVQMGSLWVRLATEHPSQEKFMNGWGKRGLLGALQFAKHYLGHKK